MEKQNVRDLIEKRLDAKFPEFKKSWNNFLSMVGDDFVNLLKDKFQDEFQLFKEISQFKISVVVDNNFIFGQLKSLVEKNKPLESSFIFRIANLSLVKIYAPPKLKEELYDKIETVLKINNSIAKEYADILLQKIEVKDAYWIDEWKKANSLIGHIDGDDVPYLALAFDLASHSIISNDKVFHKAGSTQVWTLQDTDKIITNYNKGFVSFCFLGTIPNIVQLIWKVFVAIFKVIGEVVTLMLQALTYIAFGAFAMLSEIPAPILVILIGFLVISEKAQEFTIDALIKIKESCIQFIRQFLNWFEVFMKEVIEIFTPIGITLLEFAAYFMAEFSELRIQVEILDKHRAN